MSFRLRLTLLAAAAVAVAIVGTSFVVYYADRAELIDQTDHELTAARALLPPLDAHFGPDHGQPVNGAQRLLRLGWQRIVLSGSFKAVQVQVANRRKDEVTPKSQTFTTTTIGGVHSRVLTISLPLRTVRISGSLQEVDRNLARLRWLLVFISIGGVGVAGILGALVSRRAVAPLRRLTETTERIVETGDLSARTGQRGRDEISRLSTRLDELLSTLDSSLRTQRQLVADASHELRTPIATLRANVELLAKPGVLDARERAGLLADAQEELESMTTLVGELVELARGEEPDVEPTEFRLDELVQGAVDRASRREPTLAFRTALAPSVVRGVPERIDRAVWNLIDNARKWSPPGAAVDVAVRDGVVEVRDRGPGIAEDDAPLVFNRFYRAAAARGTPGAGLGLAIVKQIADAHGGSVTVGRAPDGGAVLRLRLSSAP
jgi:two-component system sensor histidine kinase MprB